MDENELLPVKNSNDLIFSEIRRRLDDLEESAKNIDTKGVLTLSFIGAIIAGLVNSSWFLDLNFKYHLLILFSLTSTALLAFGAIIVRQYRRDPDPTNLIKNYSNKPEIITKNQLISNFEQSYTNNEQVIKDKAKFLKAAFISLSITIVILAASIIFSIHTVLIT